jgi:hypothetical protein
MLQISLLRQTISGKCLRGLIGDAANQQEQLVHTLDHFRYRDRMMSAIPGRDHFFWNAEKRRRRFTLAH